MPTHLDLKGMIDVSSVHTRYEFTHEIEPLMATVHPEPCWIIEPIGCRIASTEGVSQMYQRMFPLIGAMANPEVVNTWFAEDGFIGEVRISKPSNDGTVHCSSQFAWCEFNGDLISGEGNYFDEGDVGYAAHALGEDFFRLPGVTVTPRDI
ncbi:hypothetical protein KRR38_03455 [Novosphingobium sp. G106]|uniref:hypothetical protein n=1 Tax=Novosphingobium sp. G106 TaxID=2849500 RepID=UPI001C2CDC1B|nr:hypothetical protein [Novosphingobium sp. G106]MBV1686752.1 hypothetical protein [Novosphingobium sp. G106]